MLRWLVTLIVTVSWQAHAGLEEFKTGPVFNGFGKHADVPGVSLDASTRLKVAFDAISAAKVGEMNHQFDSLARFINMHVASGVPQENIRLALVVHGGAALDVLNAKAYKQKQGGENANIALVRALLDNGVKVIMCGQSFMGHGLSRDMLIQGVELELSAMTAHALLQQQGYTLNPF